MEIDVRLYEGRELIAIISPKGEINGSSYTEVLSKARETCMEPARNLIIDLSEVPRISSTGLVALHVVSLLINGDELPDLEAGMSAYRPSERSKPSGSQKYVILLNPQPEVEEVLEFTGMDQTCKIFRDLETAIASI